MLPGNRPIWLGDHSRSIMIIRKSQRFLWIINHGIMILRKSLVWEKEMKNAILDKVLVSVSHIGHHFLVFYRHNHRKLTISQKWLWNVCKSRLNSEIFQILNFKAWYFWQKSWKSWFMKEYNICISVKPFELDSLQKMFKSYDYYLAWNEFFWVNS